MHIKQCLLFESFFYCACYSKHSRDYVVKLRYRCRDSYSLNIMNINVYYAVGKIRVPLSCGNTGVKTILNINIY